MQYYDHIEEAFFKQNYSQHISTGNLIQKFVRWHNDLFVQPYKWAYSSVSEIEWRTVERYLSTILSQIFTKDYASRT